MNGHKMCRKRKDARGASFCKEEPLRGMKE